MNRRLFLGTTFAAALAVFAPKAVLAEGAVAYTPGVIQSALEEGQTVLVRYGAKWCTTCARQKRVINALRADDPAYDQALTFVDVDWDEYRRHDVTKDRNVPRRSTLILLKGDQELGRIVAGTSKRQIKDLMDKGVEAGA